MRTEWGIIGCAYMAQEYCRVFRSCGIRPYVYSRNLNSSNVKTFEGLFPELRVERLGDFPGKIDSWIVCTNIESHVQVCSTLTGRIYCEKPYANTLDYKIDDRITILMNRRYYHWTEFIRRTIESDQIVKVVACIPEKNPAALVPQSIHVIDLLWYLTGSFGTATRIGTEMPTFILRTEKNIPVVINMNYGSHENFSIRFYARTGTVYEAKPLEAFNTSVAMEVRAPDEMSPVRTYRPVVQPFPHRPTGFKPGISELVDELITDQAMRLPTLREHREIHSWMLSNMS